MVRKARIPGFKSDFWDVFPKVQRSRIILVSIDDLVVDRDYCSGYELFF